MKFKKKYWSRFWNRVNPLEKEYQKREQELKDFFGSHHIETSLRFVDHE